MEINLKYGHTVNVDPTAAPADFVAWAIAFAIRQSAGDADAGKAGTEEGKAAVLAKAERLCRFEIPAGGAGGPRLTPLEKARRDVVEKFLWDLGYKAADAKKAAVDPWAGFVDGIRRALSKKAGIPADKVDSALVMDAADRNWPKFEAKAKERAAKTAATVDVEI